MRCELSDQVGENDIISQQTLHKVCNIAALKTQLAQTSASRLVSLQGVVINVMQAVMNGQQKLGWPRRPPKA